MAQREEFLNGRDAVTFLDLFAGAGGISEGFMQAYTQNKYYDFILASDINENCELTHRVRYNSQLGLQTDFLLKDIMSDDFLPELLKRIDGRTIDVVTGGPSCQSFSLSGRRRKYDKRDNLFEHYLKVIVALRPKYFVMENVKGILTKDHGRFKDEIMSLIRSITDETQLPSLYKYLDTMLSKTASSFEKACLLAKVRIECEDDSKTDEYVQLYFQLLEERFKELTRNIPYQTSKSDKNISTIRHGLNLLKHYKERQSIQSAVIQEKTSSNIDNDFFVEPMNAFIESMEDDSIIKKIFVALDGVSELEKQKESVESLKAMIMVYSMTLDETFKELSKYAKKHKSEKKFKGILEKVLLYRVDRPIVVLSSDYGVPQNRERVLFIGCRNDQQLITEIPATVNPDEKVTVYEAINDLDFIGNGETCTNYGRVRRNARYDHLLRNRLINGPVNGVGENHTFAEWSRIGRLAHRFTFDCQPFYVRNTAAYHNPAEHVEQQLFNHQTSIQNDNVRRRLEIIARHGEIDEACRRELEECPLLKEIILC